jgi:hypothetical protein
MSDGKSYFILESYRTLALDLERGGFFLGQ